MAEAKTHQRIDWPTVMLVGTTPTATPEYARTLGAEGYALANAASGAAARDTMGTVMPHVVLLSRSVPMPEHRFVHEAAIAVGAEVILVPDDAHPELVLAEVEIAVQRVKKRREKG